MSEPNNERRRPTGMRHLQTVEELSTFPDGTVVVWYSQYGREHERQAGVLDTVSDGTRTIRPISIHSYESNTALADVTAPLWLLTFDDPPAMDVLGTPGIANVSDEPQALRGDVEHRGIHATLQGRGWGPPWSGPAADASRMIQDRLAD